MFHLYIIEVYFAGDGYHPFEVKSEWRFKSAVTEQYLVPIHTHTQGIKTAQLQQNLTRLKLNSVHNTYSKYSINQVVSRQNKLLSLHRNILKYMIFWIVVILNKSYDQNQSQMNLSVGGTIIMSDISCSSIGPWLIAMMVGTVCVNPSYLLL